MNNICFYYHLTISPDDINSGKIKKELDLNQLRFHPKVLKNEDVFHQVHFYLPDIDYSKMNRYYINIEKDGYKIELIFVEIITSHASFWHHILDNSSYNRVFLFDVVFYIHN